jgi:LCP family protein required for cell wall assembly
VTTQPPSSASTGDTQPASPAGTSDAPPHVGRRLLWRALLAGVLICLMTAGAVSAAVLLQVDDIIQEFEKQGRAAINIPEIDRADAGKAQTLMILGSDRRYQDKKLGLKPRSDTIILVRLDPDKSVLAMMSIPRDLLVEIPGLGRTKINAAYESGGERGTVRTVKKLLSTSRRPFKINHVITVDFRGFRRAIDYVGCVYADIDRHYLNTHGGPGGFATIDIEAGYQKVCGKDALDYVRYRHTDNDLVRAARQQDFLRQVRNQKGIRKLMSYDPRNLKKLARIFGRYFDSDKGLHKKKQIFAFAKTVLFTAQNPVREVRFRVSESADHVNLEASQSQLKETVDEFLEAKASDQPRQGSAARPRSARKRKGRRSRIAGLVQAKSSGQDQAIVLARRAKLPFYFPTLLTGSGAYQPQQNRAYAIKDELGKRHRAYRMVVSKQMFGEYYGIQGMTWRFPPILDDPHSTIVRNGRSLMVFRDGRRVRLVAWRTRKAVYWVSNTLTQSLSSQQMLGIAASLRRFGRG